MTSKQYVQQALQMLGVERLALAIHDQSFPSLRDQETGRGSPYSPGGHKFLQFIADLGFNAMQLGPQGRTSLANPSPYDSTLFSKNELSISLHSLKNDEAWKDLIEPKSLDELTANCPSTHGPRNFGAYQHAWRAHHKALHDVYIKFKELNESQQLLISFMAWTQQQSEWTERDAMFEVLAKVHETDDWRQWPAKDQQLWLDYQKGEPSAVARYEELRSEHSEIVDHYYLYQFLAHRQHEQFRELAEKLGVRLYADMQIGFSQKDIWGLRALFVQGYLLGAPPSRTNPNGQPWGYPVLDPHLFGNTAANDEGPALTLFIERINKLLQDFDGLRVDHPHGLVCPWMYKSDEPDALHAVQNGARLHESPNLPDHPALAKYAIARAEQLASPESGIQRYADGWVQKLDESQVKRYSFLIQTIKEQMAKHNRDTKDLVCEVLSSCPYPLKAVLESNGLGRFRVTQKAQPKDDKDVYRSDNAQPPDWIMLGTHDTKPIWMVVEKLTQEDRSAWAHYLANRLESDTAEREKLQQKLSTSEPHLVEAMFADLFIGPAKNISVFFSDLLGIKQEYNAPGVICDTNWVVSVPNDYETVYNERLASRSALNISRALAMALKARFPNSKEAQQLAAKLEKSESSKPIPC